MPNYLAFNKSTMEASARVEILRVQKAGVTGSVEGAIYQIIQAFIERAPEPLAALSRARRLESS